MTITPNRVATWLTAASGAAAAIAVPVANLDPTDLLPGLGAIAVAFVTWMQGWQKHEAAVTKPAGQVLYGTGLSPHAPGDWNIRTWPESPARESDEDNSALEAVDGDALAPTEPKIGGDE